MKPDPFPQTSHSRYLRFFEAARDGIPIWDPAWQANVDDGVIARIVAPAAGSATIPLLSDREGRVIEAYGAWGEKNMYGKKSMGIIRSTVVIAPDGTVKKVFPKVKVDGHVGAVLAAIDA